MECLQTIRSAWAKVCERVASQPDHFLVHAKEMKVKEALFDTLRADLPDAHIQLPNRFDRKEIDLTVACGSANVAIEVKFKVQSDGAYTNNRSEAFKDLDKLRQYTQGGAYSHGVFVWLTDRPEYYRDDVSAKRDDSTHHGRVYVAGPPINVKRTRGGEPGEWMFPWSLKFEWKACKANADWRWLLIQIPPESMERNVLDSVSPERLGRALQAARKRKGMTQEEAANVLDVARTTVVAIEKGERRIRPGELLKLGHAYGRQVSDILMASAASGPAPQFRGPTFETERDRELIEPFIDEFEELCRQYLQLEQLTGTLLVRNYPRPYETKGISVDQAAESIAIQERNRLGLGDGPLPALRDLLEQDVGFRLFFLPLPPRYSEIYWCTDELGACMAINRAHPEERRRWSMAHAYAHFLTSRYKAKVSMFDGYQRRPESERLADAFAAYFLMPTNGLIRRFSEIKSASGKFTPTDLCVIAHYYGVSVEALALRLESTGLLGTGKWDELQARGLKVREAQARLGLSPTTARDDRLPTRFVSLALEALDQGLITEGRFANLLSLSIVEARELAEDLRPADSPTEDEIVAAPATPRSAAY